MQGDGTAVRQALDGLPDLLHVELAEHGIREVGHVLAVRVGEQRRHAGILEPLPQQAQRPLRAGVEEQADGQGHGPTMADGAGASPRKSDGF